MGPSVFVEKELAMERGKSLRPFLIQTNPTGKNNHYGNFWSSSSSARWEQGKIVTLRYDEYNAEGDIKILEVEIDKKIVFEWVG